MGGPTIRADAASGAGVRDAGLKREPNRMSRRYKEDENRSERHDGKRTKPNEAKQSECRSYLFSECLVGSGRLRPQAMIQEEASLMRKRFLL